MIRHCKVDDNGLVIWANLIIATGNSDLAMNRSIKQVSRAFVDGAVLDRVGRGAP